METTFAVPVQAMAFLGAVAGIVMVLIVFFLYMNKKLCFNACGGFPCMDHPPHKDKQMLGTAYAYEDPDSSSDSDDEVLRHYQKSIRRTPSQHSLQSRRSSRARSTVGPIISVVHILDSDPEDDTPVIPQAKSLSADTPVHATPNEPSPQHSQFSHDESLILPDSTTDPELGNSLVSIANKDENLFDISDLQDQEVLLISKCGNLEVSFDYSTEMNRMMITVHQAQDIPSKDRGGANNTQVRLLLLPTKKVKHKTKIKPGKQPEFQEKFEFKVPAEEAVNMGVRFRLYGCERMRRERMIGECVIGFASLNLEEMTTFWLTLEPRSNLSHSDSKFDVSSLSKSDSASSTQSMQHGGMPELLCGLAYNGTTGRLSVEVIKGSNFKNMAMNRAPDTYVRLTLMAPSGQEITKSKTSVRRGQPNPLYKETFMFQVALFQLPDVTLMVSVYDKRSMKRKDMIGWFSLGYSSSGDEEVSHWNDMRENKGEQVCRWHVLLEA